MDFAVLIGKEEDGATWFKFTQYNDMLDFIHNHMAGWNNFTPDKSFIVTVTKVKSDTDTIEVKTNEEIDTGDVFGQR